MPRYARATRRTRAPRRSAPCSAAQASRGPAVLVRGRLVDRDARCGHAVLAASRRMTPTPHDSAPRERAHVFSRRVPGDGILLRDFRTYSNGTAVVCSENTRGLTTAKPIRAHRGARPFKPQMPGVNACAVCAVCLGRLEAPQRERGVGWSYFATLPNAGLVRRACRAARRRGAAASAVPLLQDQASGPRTISNPPPPSVYPHHPPPSTSTPHFSPLPHLL